MSIFLNGFDGICHEIGFFFTVQCAAATVPFGNLQDKAYRWRIHTAMSIAFDLSTTKERTKEEQEEKCATSERSFGLAQLVWDFYSLPSKNVDGKV